MYNFSGRAKDEPILGRDEKESSRELPHLAVTQVNIKATTMETMGFVGKKEGIGAIAVALLEK
ncbi:hypothetical protein RMBD60P2_18100 [Enterococcus faecalis]